MRTLTIELLTYAVAVLGSILVLVLLGSLLVSLKGANGRAEAYTPVVVEYHKNPANAPAAPMPPTK